MQPPAEFPITGLVIAGQNAERAELTLRDAELERTEDAKGSADVD